MQTQQLPTEIARQFDCSSDEGVTQTPASARRAKLEMQIQEYLSRGNAITEVKTNIVASLKPEKPSRDQIEKPRPNKHMGKHHKNNDAIMVNLREAAQILGISAPTMSQWITKGKIKTAARNSESNERLVLKKDVLELKQQRDAQKESQS